MKTTLLFIARLIGTIAISIVLLFCFYYLTLEVIMKAYFWIPSFFSINLSPQEVLQDVYRNSIIPGWGTISSIFGFQSIGLRLNLFIYIIIISIALYILEFVSNILISIMKGSKLLIFIYSIIAIFFFVFTVRAVYFIDLSMFGVNRGIWFYILSLPIMFGLFSIFSGIALCSSKDE